MKKETAAQRVEPSLFDEEYMAPAVQPEATFAAEPLTPPTVLELEPEAPPPVAEVAAPRSRLKPALLGGVAVLVAALIGAIAWIGSTAGQHPKKEAVIAAPQGMSAKALPPPDFSHPPAPEHVPSAIPLPPHAEGGTPDAAVPPPAEPPPAARTVAPVVLGARAPQPESPVRAVPAIRDEVRVARRVKTASPKATAAKRPAKTATAKTASPKKAAKAAAPAKKKVAAARTARKAVPPRCTAHNKATAACRAKSQKAAKA